MLQIGPWNNRSSMEHGFLQQGVEAVHILNHVRKLKITQKHFINKHSIVSVTSKRMPMVQAFFAIYSCNQHRGSLTTPVLNVQ